MDAKRDSFRTGNGDSGEADTGRTDLSRDRDARINVRQLSKTFLIALAIPLATGIFVDVAFDTTPMATIVLGFIAIPLTTFFVLRATLAEFDRVIEQVAPFEAEDGAGSGTEALTEMFPDDGDKSWSGTGLFDDDPSDRGLYVVAENPVVSLSADESPDRADQEADPKVI